MVTSAALYHVMNFFHITIDIRNVCVFLAPLFSSLTTLVTYHFTKELKVCIFSVKGICTVLAVHFSFLNCKFILSIVKKNLLFL